MVSTQCAHTWADNGGVSFPLQFMTTLPPAFLATRAVALSRLRAISIRQSLADHAEANAAPLTSLPTKGQLTRNRQSYKQLARRLQSSAMTNMAPPAGHRPVPTFVGKRERILFAAHASRKDAGWIRG